MESPRYCKDCKHYDGPKCKLFSSELNTEFVRRKKEDCDFWEEDNVKS